MLSRELRPSAWQSPRSQYPRTRLSDSVTLGSSSPSSLHTVAVALMELRPRATHTSPLCCSNLIGTGTTTYFLSSVYQSSDSRTYSTEQRYQSRAHVYLLTALYAPRLSSRLRACLPAFFHFIHNPRNNHSVQRGEPEACRARSLGWPIISRWNMGCGRMCQWTWTRHGRGGGV